MTNNLNTESSNKIDKLATGLLNETISKKEIRKVVVDFKNINNKNFIVLQIVLSIELKRIINSLGDGKVDVWKEKFHSIINNTFDDKDINILSILNLEPFKRTIILSYNKEGKREDIKKRLISKFNELVKILKDEYMASVIGCFGSVQNNFADIGFSYKDARKLQEHSFSIGLSNIAFYEDANLHERLNLVEYKFIDRFETNIRDENWIQTGILIEKLKDILGSKLANNSKIIHIYKELFSLTIRYLLVDEIKNTKEISRLNDSISSFEDEFNDIKQVHDFYISVMETVAASRLTDSTYSLYIRKTLEIIKSQYMKPLSLSNIADDLKISVSYLSRLFKEETGMNFIEYLLEHRIQKAKHYLSHTDMNINEIAIKTGYMNHTQFTRSFKKREGVTPSFYRSN